MSEYTSEFTRGNRIGAPVVSGLIYDPDFYQFPFEYPELFIIRSHYLMDDDTGNNASLDFYTLIFRRVGWRRYDCVTGKDFY